MMTGKTRMNKREKLALLADIEDGYRPFDKHALTLLRALIDDSDAEVRAEAIACLWNDPSPQWIDVLINKVNDDPHAEVRAHAISALGRYIYEGEEAEFEGWDAPFFEITQKDYDRVTQFLLRIAQDLDEGLEARRYAIEALAFREDDAEVLALIEWAYRHHDQRLKVSALFAMARNGNPRWTPYILADMKSANPQIQYEAVRAAGELGLYEATDTLIELALGKGVRKPLRLLAIFALGETGDERAYDVLDKLTRSRDRDIRDVAREALEEWRTVTEMEQLADQGFDPEDADDMIAEHFETDSFPDIWGGQIGTFSRN